MPFLATFGAATVLTSALLLGSTTSTLDDPATACAKRKGLDWDRYEACVRIAEDLYIEGKIDKGTLLSADEGCCVNNGGIWVDDLETGEGHCEDPPPNEYPAPPAGQLPQIPGPTEATQVPPPPAHPGNTAAPLPGSPPVQTR